MQYKKSSVANFFLFSDCSDLKMKGNAVFLNVVWSAGLKTERHFPENTGARASYLSKLYWFQSQYIMTQDIWNSAMIWDNWFSVSQNTAVFDVL
jgi:hypothetical protein